MCDAIVNGFIGKFYSVTEYVERREEMIKDLRRLVVNVGTKKE